MNFLGASIIYIALFTATVVSGLSDVKIFILFLSGYGTLSSLLGSIFTTISSVLVGWTSMKRMNLFISSEEIE